MKKLSETLKELGIEFKFPINIEKSNGNITYYESSSGFWFKKQYHSSGNVAYYKDSDGYWNTRNYDAKGNVIYYENGKGKKKGTPRNQTCEGKVVEIDGLTYELKLKN